MPTPASIADAGPSIGDSWRTEQWKDLVEDLAEDLSDKLKVDCETATEAQVSGEGVRYWYRVHLKRIVKSSSDRPGIWTATMVEYAPPNPLGHRRLTGLGAPP
jgi:hypothetical protein